MSLRGGSSSSPVAALVKGGEPPSYRDVLVSARPSSGAGSSSGDGARGGWVKVVGRKGRRLTADQNFLQTSTTRRFTYSDLRLVAKTAFSDLRLVAKNL
jgi:hypothetical protein